MTSQMIAWKEPPEPRTRGRKASEEYVQLAFELKAKPGQWAYIGIRKTPKTVTAFRKATIGAFAPAGSFEARAVKSEDGTDYDLYVRYIGEPTE
jgi:hypothetical protein